MDLSCDISQYSTHNDIAKHNYSLNNIAIDFQQIVSNVASDFTRRVLCCAFFPHAHLGGLCF